MIDDILGELDRVFQSEIDTLVHTRENLGDSYVRAVELIFQCKGNVVVSGMGKSGLIARKIAATMASTGTPAIYLHPGDAMHGDVGIIREGDVVLAISKSGETQELLDLLLYVKEVGVPVVSITAKPESALGRRSDLVLFTPVEEEACPLNLAPTSSTTVALVVGDGLAVALMKLRGFQPEQFALLHPGGQLGKRLLLKVADIMRSGDNNPVVSLETSMKDTLSQITSKHSGAVSVVNREGKLLGLITDYDIRKALEGGLDIFSLQAADIMNRSAISIFSDEKAVKAFDLMENHEKPYLVLPVLDRSNEKVVGMVHLHDMVVLGL